MGYEDINDAIDASFEAVMVTTLFDDIRGMALAYRVEIR